MRHLHEDEFGPTHCMDCGTEFGKRYMLARLAGVPITGDIAYADYEGSVLCGVCMDRAVERDAKR